MSFENRLYFTLQEMFIGYIDLDTDEINFTCSEAADFPKDGYGDSWTLGVMTKLPNGKVFVRVDVVFGPGTWVSNQIYSLVIGYVLNADLDPATAVPWYGNVEYDAGIRDARYVPTEQGVGQPDPSNNTVILEWSDSKNVLETPAPTLARFDMDGEIVEEFGDVSGTVQSYVQDQGGMGDFGGDGFWYRTSNVASEFNRVPLDGGRYDYAIPMVNYSTFASNDMAYLGKYDGKFWFLERDRQGVYGTAFKRYITSYDPDEFNWRSIDTVGESLTSADNVVATDHYLLETPVAPDTAPYNLNYAGQYAGFAYLRDNLIYYFGERSFEDYDWGELDDGNGMGFGSACRIIALDLDTGDRSIVYNIPYGFLNSEGDYVRADDPDWWDDTNNNFYGLNVALVTVAGVGRVKINVGTEEDREWKFLNPKTGENGGFGRGKVNIGTNENRDWVFTSEMTSGKMNIGDDEGRDWVAFNQ